MIPLKWERMALVTPLKIYSCWTLYNSGSLIRPLRTLVGRKTCWLEPLGGLNENCCFLENICSHHKAKWCQKEQTAFILRSKAKCLWNEWVSDARQMCCGSDPWAYKKSFFPRAGVTVTGQGHRHQQTPGAACSSLTSRSLLGGWGQCFLSVISTRQAFCYWNETKKWEKKYLSGQLGLKIHFNSSVHCYLYRVFCSLRRRVGGAIRKQSQSWAGQWGWSAAQCTRIGVSNTCRWTHILK